MYSIVNARSRFPQALQKMMVRNYLDGLMVFAISQQNGHYAWRPQCDNVAFYCIHDAVSGMEQDLKGRARSILG